MNPELSNREFETAKLVGSKLTSLAWMFKPHCQNRCRRTAQRQPAGRDDRDAGRHGCLAYPGTEQHSYKSLNSDYACLRPRYPHIDRPGHGHGPLQIKTDEGNINSSSSRRKKRSPGERGADLMIKEGSRESRSGGHFWPSYLAEDIGQINFSPVLSCQLRLFQIQIKGKRLTAVPKRHRRDRFGLRDRHGSSIHRQPEIDPTDRPS